MALLNPAPIRLWPDAAPGALGSAEVDIPTLTPYLPEHPNGTAIVVCPGGGYAMLADHEGRDYALWFNRLGVTAFVLKYRLATNGYHYPAMFWDVERTMRTVRYHAADYRVDPNRIGIIGSSAGGHLASMALTLWAGGSPHHPDPVEHVSARPDFGVLCYAGIDLAQFWSGGIDNLLGPNPSEELKRKLSTQLAVDARTPPTFLWSTKDDDVVPIGNSKAFAGAMAKAGVEHELFIMPHGPHGLGLGGKPDSEALLPWTEALEKWLVHIRML